MIRFDTLPPEVTQAMCTPMHQILPPAQNPSNPSQYSGALFLGSLSAVMDKDLLRENRITHLVHVLDVQWLPMSEQEGFVGYKIAIADQDSEDIRPHLEAVCTHIDAALKSGRNVLVHCHQGVSRSAAVVIAYLIRNQGMSFDNAQSFVKRKRACIKPNSGFMRALQEWEIAWRRPNMLRRFTT
ncbi:protein-tyrosine phosphatase-like protein [Ephemerocybe angulata]|uniref:protein-tyrosine-phosphatase n=1 Tax=Ephemerocybe angulata TaxID=980116 RepID=A0A8H6M7Y8_9AGAR|nr:protein-tyrosine phosphatase-like protein [Tulosesus angulatus]KAF6759213.1 protein-tyrosine phosphatase-like protein [Tulosesus angulatus]